MNTKYLKKMTKADIVNEISRTTGIEKAAVQTTVEAFMEAIKGSVIDGKNVYLSHQERQGQARHDQEASPAQRPRHAYDGL